MVLTHFHDQCAATTSEVSCVLTVGDDVEVSLKRWDGWVDGPIMDEI